MKAWSKKMKNIKSAKSSLLPSFFKNITCKKDSWSQKSDAYKKTSVLLKNKYS